MNGLLSYCTDLPIITLTAGEVLIEQGADAGALYVLVEGALVVERDGVAFARIDTPGAVFGEMAAVLGQSTTATARVTEASTFRVAEDPIAFLSECPGAALEVLRLAATRLDSLTRYLVDVKRQYADLSGHLAMVDDVLNVLVHHQPRAARPGSAREPEPDY
ncbi:MAG: Crp/Fnr family transcriptional regulator [Acidimicrobiales bacterium]